MSRDWLAYFKAKRNMGAVICEGPEIEAACLELDRLHSGYADLLARHNALVEGIKKERSLLKLIGSCRNSPKEGVSPSAAVADLASARAEVDRLLNEAADCEGEGC